MKPKRKTLLRLGLFGLAPLTGAIGTLIWLRDSEQEPESEFYATGNLTRKISVEQAQANERYSDPLGLAPTVPFGHLSGAWKRFLSQKPIGGELWEFNSLEKPPDKGWGPHHVPSRGYAWIVRGVIKSEIVVEG